MSVTYIATELRRLVVERARARCEYCLLPAGVAFFPHEVDHVIAEKHGGMTTAENLALVCWRCNRHKGSDLGSFDPLTLPLRSCSTRVLRYGVPTLHSRASNLVGLSPEGRVTVHLLRLNSEERLAERWGLWGRMP